VGFKVYSVTALLWCCVLTTKSTAPKKTGLTCKSWTVCFLFIAATHWHNGWGNTCWEGQKANK